MNEHDESIENPEQDSYETGSTRPPKSYGGLVAILLVVVILLCGTTSYLSILNIRLVQLIEGNGDTDSQIQFLPADTIPGRTEDETNHILPGVEGRTVSGPEQAYYHWPAGVVVTKVAPDSAAAEAGLAMGDILTAINDYPITDLASLNAVAQKMLPGMRVTVTYCRDGETYHDFICVWK